MSAPQRFPLAWPAGRPRTAGSKRQPGQFKANEKRITRLEAMKRLETEVARLGGTNLLVSSDLQLRADGQPHMGKPEPYDPGVVAFFTLKGEAVSMPCDTFGELAQNIAAIAAHIEATRRQTRYGVATAAESLQAFMALPSPEGGITVARPWREVLGLRSDFPEGLDRDEAEMVITRRFRLKASDAHPDVKGGSEAKMADLNRARDEAMQAVRSV